MLFPFKFIDHALNKVGEIPCYFLEKSLEKNRFSLQLFPAWFRPVLKKLPTLKEYFEEVYKETRKIKSLKTKELNQLYDDLIKGYDVEKLCRDTSLSPPRSKPVSDELHDKLKALYNYFFTETLKESKNLFTALKGTYDQQYKNFRDENLILGKVCPMCGLHEYPLRSNEPKAQYDHWLPQDIYPLLAINFLNLVPICGICNNIKRQSDLLFDKAARTISFYPYQGHAGLSFRILSYVPVDKLGKEDQDKYIYGKYEWEIECVENTDTGKLASWDRVFHIRNRYSSYISDYYDEIKTTLKEYMVEKGIAFVNGSKKEDLIIVLQQFQAHRIKDVKRETGSHLKKAFLKFISDNGNESLLYTFFGIKSTAA